MNFRNKLISASVLSAITLLSACSYNQMVKMAQDQEVTVNPSPLELHGDSVKFEVSAALPLNMLKKNRLYTLKTYYNYGDPSETFEQIEFTDTEFPNQQVEQPNITKDFSFYYEDGMESGKLMLKGIVSNLEKTKFKETAEIDIAKGIITTSRLVKNTVKPTYAWHGYNTGEELIPINVDFFFDKGSSKLKGSEIKSNNGQKLDAYIASKNTTRTVTITGSHSPEGKESINSELSENRAKVIKEFYFNKMKQYDYKNMADSIKFETKVIFQDWAPFKAKLASYDGITAEQKQQVLSAISTPGAFEVVEKSLESLSFYNKLVTDLYPSLRTTTTEILSVKQKKTEAEINVLAKAIVNGKASYDTLKVDELMYAATLTPLLEEKAAIYQAATKYDIWEAYNNLGATYLEMTVNAVSLEEKKENLEKAIAQLKIAKNKEENAVILNNIAAIQLSLGARDEAYANYEKAYSIAESDSVKNVIAAGLGTCEIKYGKYTEAISHLEKGVKDLPSAVFNLGLAQLLNKDFDNAENSFEGAIFLDKKDGIAYYCSAIVGARTKKSELLEKKLKSAIANDESLREKAINDLEFDLYKETPAFKNAIQ